MLVGLILVAFIFLLNLNLDPFVELLNLLYSLASFNVHLLLLVKWHKINRTKRVLRVLPINYLEWGFIGSSTWSMIVGKLGGGKEQLPSFQILLN